MRRRIAWHSPLPPQRSGIANYSYRLVRALKPHFDIDLYCEAGASEAVLKDEFNVYPLSVFAEHYQSYDEVIYHLGNNSRFHKAIYKLAWDHPGTVVLHDYDLTGFMHQAFRHQSDERFYEQALLEGYGDEGRKAMRELAQGLSPNPGRFPMSHPVVGRSKKVIVHHRWVKNQFSQNGHIEVIPHFAALNHVPTDAEIERFKQRLGIGNEQFVLACLGYVNSNKLPELQIEVVKRLHENGYPVRLIFAGEPAPELKNLLAKTSSGEFAENFIFTGYLSDADYFTAIFASDVIINLRSPSMGEASGTLMHALAAGKPTVVSDINQYREFPDTVCWKLSHDKHEQELLYHYLKVLLGDRRLRAAISANVRQYVNTTLKWEDIVSRWVKLLSRAAK